MKITKGELKSLIKECLREELSKHSSLKESLWNCYFDDHYVGTVEAPSEYEAKVRMMDKYPEYPYGMYDGCFWVEPEDDETLTESSLTPEEKVDAWHAGTRRENYKACGIPKLKTFLEIAERKGYTEIVDILVGELEARGETVTTKLAPVVDPEPTVADDSDELDWDDTIAIATDMLEEICTLSGNEFYNDGDGYWSGEVGVRWCYRYMYYKNSLDNTEELKKLCDEYSSRLPGVAFYFVEDDVDPDDAVSEIGFEINRDDM